MHGQTQIKSNVALDRIRNVSLYDMWLLSSGGKCSTEFYKTGCYSILSLLCYMFIATMELKHNKNNNNVPVIYLQTFLIFNYKKLHFINLSHNWNVCLSLSLFISMVRLFLVMLSVSCLRCGVGFKEGDIRWPSQVKKFWWYRLSGASHNGGCDWDRRSESSWVLGYSCVNALRWIDCREGATGAIKL
jgi:hypothetical protein